MESIKTAVILAGGKGTRFSEYTKTVPKPMIIAKGQPLLVHIMNIYISQNITNFIILAGYKSEIILEFFAKNCKKVIASTDPELRIKTGSYKLDGEVRVMESLPQLSKDFIKAYVKAYNEGNPIKKVMVEYEIKKYLKKGVGKYSHPEYYVDEFKLTDNNEVIIHLEEEKMYSREEVLDLLSDFAESEIGPDYQEITNLDKFIEENL